MIFVFDAYGTLVELDGFYDKLQDGFSSRGILLPIETVKRAARREMRHYIAHSQRANCATTHAALHRECAQILHASLQEFQPRFNLSVDATEEVLASAIAFRLFPETREVLEALKARGVQMAVASNWDYTLASHLENLDIAHFFRFIFSSAELGAEKPSPQFFQMVKEEAQTTIGTQRLFYIGDHYDKDVVPSQAAGFQPLWLVRDERDVASGEVHEASEIVPLRSLRDVLSSL